MFKTTETKDYRQWRFCESVGVGFKRIVTEILI